MHSPGGGGVEFHLYSVIFHACLRTMICVREAIIIANAVVKSYIKCLNFIAKTYVTKGIYSCINQTRYIEVVFQICTQ